MEGLLKASFIVTIIAVVANHGLATESVYKRLLDHVMSQSDDPHLPPITDLTTPLKVSVHLGLRDISKVDPLNNLVDISLLTTVTWNSSITWNPADYNNLPFISIPRNRVWHPKLAILNAAKHYDDLSPPDTTLFSNGFTGIFHQHHVQIFCDLSSPSSEESYNNKKCNVSVGFATHGNNLIRLEDPKDFPVQNVESFYLLARHNVPGWQLNPDTNRIVKTSSSQAGLPGEKEQVDLEFSFRDSRRGRAGAHADGNNVFNLWH